MWWLPHGRCTSFFPIGALELVQLQRPPLARRHIEPLEMVTLTYLPNEGPATGDARSGTRIGLVADVRLRHPGKPSFRVKVLDLSPQGCRVEFVDRPRIGDFAWVKFGGLESLRAQACWVGQTYAGFKFENGMHPATFRHLILTLRQYEA